MRTTSQDEYWIQEGTWDPYLGHWVVDLVYSDQEGEAESQPAAQEAPEGNPPVEEPKPASTSETSNEVRLRPAYQFAVYLDEDLNVQWFFNNLDGKTAHLTDKWFCDKFDEISSQTVHLQILSECLRVSLSSEYEPPTDTSQRWTKCSRMRLKQKSLRSVRWMIAEALSHAVRELPVVPPGMTPETDPRYLGAVKTLEVTRAHLVARSAERGRLRLFLGALSGVLLTLVSWMILMSLFCQSPDGKAQMAQVSQSPSAMKACCVWWFGWMNESGWEVMRIAHLGSLGAMLSLLLLAAGRTYDAGSMQWVHYVEGLCRIAVGVIGALFVLLIMKAGLVGSVFLTGKAETTGWVLAVLAILSGFSEKLVPDFATLLGNHVLPALPDSNGKPGAPVGK